MFLSVMKVGLAHLKEFAIQNIDNDFINVAFADGHVKSVRPYGLKAGNFTVTW